MSEVRIAFRSQIAEIEDRIEQLFAFVTEGLAAATDAVLSGDREVVRLLVERDGAVDAVHRDVEDLVNVALVDHVAAAADLRFLLSVLRIAPELERSHDLVEHIARRGAQGLGAAVSPRSRGLIERMGTLGVEMWRLCADAWVSRNPLAVDHLEERDDELDELHATLCAEVVIGAHSLPVAMDMALVARFFERLGDHAVNISRRIVYLAGADAVGAGAGAAGDAVGVIVPGMGLG